MSTIKLSKAAYGIIADMNRLKRQQKEKKDALQKMLTEQHSAQLKSKYENTFWTFDNGYSYTERWTVYYQVLSVKSDDLHVYNDGSYHLNVDVLSFEKNANGTIEIKKDRVYTSMLQKKITEPEFIKAWNKIIDEINSY